MHVTPTCLGAIYRVNGVVPKNGRRMTAVPFPYAIKLPLQLKDSVSGKSEKNSGVACLQETVLLLACFKSNDFNQEFCSKEIIELQKCHENSLAANRAKKVQDEQGLVTPGAKKLSHKQMNILLKKYPQPN